VHRELIELTRRQLFSRGARGLGAIALASLLDQDLGAAPTAGQAGQPGLPGLPHFAPKAKHVIYLFQSGGPSQIDLYDHKPGLTKLQGADLPGSIRKGQRLTGMTAAQASFPVASSKFAFARHGQSGQEFSELLPFTAGVADDIAIIRSMNTEQINHDPAATFLQTGHQLAGRPSMGSWLAYGLGSENRNLPAFIAMISRGTKAGQPLYSRLWGSGFLPTRYQGVKFGSGKDPVLYLSNPPGFDRQDRRHYLDRLAAMNRIRQEQYGDPEIETRIEQYEMAFRMQASVPELTDFSNEPEKVFDLYGPEAKNPGSYAANCLLARRLVERGVRFVQLFHRDWDHHGGLPKELPTQCKGTDQASAALIKDLKQRGLLDETLIVWGGEFGRTVYCQGALTKETYGRDHHPRCFSIWMAGGGVKGGLTYGSTDDFSYNVAENPVSVHDLHATMLHLLGVDHKRLTFQYQGRHFRLTDVHGEVVRPLLA
jgi:hypothetical protein